MADASVYFGGGADVDSKVPSPPGERVRVRVRKHESQIAGLTQIFRIYGSGCF